MNAPPVPILLVDDEAANLLALEAILEPLGEKLVRAASGREALRHALKDDYALILMDVQMPDMDGFETAELLRKRARTRHVPIIFVTAISKERQLVARGYDVGAVDYLFKPYDPDVLRAKVAVFVELARKNEIIRTQHEALRVMSERELADLKQRTDQRYADLADSMPLLVWTTDAEGHLQYGNDRWTDLAHRCEAPREEGVAPSDARRSLDFASVIAPDDLPCFLEGWNAAVARGQAWEAEVRFGSPAVGYRVHLVRAIPRRDDGGRITAWIGTSTDIDERVRVERLLRMLVDASRRLGAMLDHPAEMEAALRDALPVIGDLASLDILGASDAPKRISVSSGDISTSVIEDPRFALGPSTVAYTGRPEVYLDVAHELDQTRSSRGAQNLRFLHELGVTSYMCLSLGSREHSSGTLTLARTGASSPFTNEDVAVAEDLALRIGVAIDNVRLHESAERRRVALERANTSKDVFLATLSHELRTPLNAIVGWTDMMRTGRLAPDELGRAIETIERNAQALSHLVADLLDVSRIVTGSLKIDTDIVAPSAVVEAAVEAIRPQCTAKGLACEVATDPIGCIRGDAARLRQVVGNLLSNALKFTPRGGTIAVRVARDGASARIEIADSGEGIAPALLPHVFERFRQAENAKARGLGLGLAIVKHLVDAHGGEVTVVSEGVGKGAKFTVCLPLADDAVAPNDAGVGSAPPLGHPELDGVHALVVEDDPDGNELITTILERYGARVTSVGTAADALDALDRDPPDVLVSDIGLPDSDGLELIKRIRSRAASAQMPAIALTAYVSRQDAAKAIGAGFDTHVAKPVQPSALGAAVAKLVMTRRANATSLPAA